MSNQRRRPTERQVPRPTQQWRRFLQMNRPAYGLHPMGSESLQPGPGNQRLYRKSCRIQAKLSVLGGSTLPFEGWTSQGSRQQLVALERDVIPTRAAARPWRTRNPSPTWGRRREPLWGRTSTNRIYHRILEDLQHCIKLRVDQFNSCSRLSGHFIRRYLTTSQVSCEVEGVHPLPFRPFERMTHRLFVHFPDHPLNSASQRLPFSKGP